ncbi:LysR family transcriptional regulator, partial [Vibrio cyclitrophicus]|uniref:LysR family transcriptional regulator n=1 Tax=Vibrio cyclitrophicus TaxID=47951 RepID=UPI0021BD95EF
MFSPSKAFSLNYFTHLPYSSPNFLKALFIMKALNDLNIFVETARQGSFSKAANSMDMTPAAISASIKRLEGQIGFPLFVRSTRSL